MSPTRDMTLITDEEHAKINALLDALGGYHRVFNALCEAVWQEANGKAVSPMTFAAAILSPLKR